MVCDISVFIRIYNSPFYSYSPRGTKAIAGVSVLGGAAMFKLA